MVSVLSGGCGSNDAVPVARGAGLPRENAAPDSAQLPQYTGTDARGIPRYASRKFTAEERDLLRRVYGVEEPSRLYISDSSDDGLLKYDTQVKKCRSCYVNSYRIGFVSVRRAGESWEQLEKRVRRMPLSAFSAGAHNGSASIGALDPDIQADVQNMLDSAASQGFVLRIVATYRSPEREAFLMAKGRGATHTLTSLHSYGRALDVKIGDGNLSRAVTREQYVAFRRWVSRYKKDQFRILGTPDRTWDWAHVEVPSASIGFATIDAAIAKASDCGGRASCDFLPHLPRSN